jgi:site-specific DNA-methyltransferase (adenine-specific)
LATSRVLVRGGGADLDGDVVTMPELNQIILADCMDIMRDIPNKYFELAIVDPIYGVNETAYREKDRSKLAKTKTYPNSIWSQKKTEKSYFIELIRISKNQIIWGGNYFANLLENSRCWIVWDKVNTCDFADCELAWTSFDKSVRQFTFKWNGMLQGNMAEKEIRIHPTQKPVALYRWLLQKYAKPGDKIIDTHSGSGSCAVACHIEKHGFLAIEKDADYHAASVRRLYEIRAQGTLF